MPTSPQQVSEPTKTTLPSSPLDTDGLTSLLRQTLFADPEEEQTQAQTETETEEEESESSEEIAEDDAESEESETESNVEDDNADEAEESKADDEEKQDKQLSKGVQKRIDKLVAQKKEAEAKLQALAEKLAETESQAANSQKEVIVSDKGLNPYFKLQSDTDVHAEIRNARQVRRWAEENPDGAVVPGKNGEEIEYSAEDIRKIKLNAIDALEEHLPSQLNYIQTRKQFDAEAEKTYPFWKQRSSQEYQYANALIREFPEIQKFPDFKLSIGDMIEGKRIRESKVKPTSAIKKAPSNPKQTASAPVQTSKSMKARSTEEAFRKNPNQDSLKALLAERFL
jgi:type I site-specific restriction endonuclease